MDKHLIISEREKLIRILCASILYLQADGNYTFIFLKGKKKHCAAKNLGHFEEQLNPQYFFRTHDKFIVSLPEVMEYEKARGGYAVMSDGTRVSVSCLKKKNFLDAFNSQ